MIKVALVEGSYIKDLEKQINNYIEAIVNDGNVVKSVEFHPSHFNRYFASIVYERNNG